jgi:hypothetical protein
MNDGTVTLNFKLHLARPSRRIVVRDGSAPAAPEVPKRLPRITRLLVQGHRLQRMIDQGLARDLADLSRQLGLTRARITQIVNYTRLAPDIQEDILFLPRVEPGEDRSSEHRLRAILREPLWAEQRKRWRELVAAASAGAAGPDANA